jgi:hypothetical protein
MRSVASRLAAALTLAALLACSGLGVCWRQLAHDAHDCCAKDDAIATPSKPCASAVASEATLKLVPPAVAVALFVFTAPTLEASPAARVAPSAVSSTKSPPLVLRV